MKLCRDSLGLVGSEQPVDGGTVYIKGNTKEIKEYRGICGCEEGAVLTGKAWKERETFSERV